MLVLLLLLISGLINRSGLGISHSKVFSSVLTWNSRISPELFQWASGLSSDGFYLKVSLCHFNVQVGFVVTVFLPESFTLSFQCASGLSSNSFLPESLTLSFQWSSGLIRDSCLPKSFTLSFQCASGLDSNGFYLKSHSVLSVVKWA